MNLVWLVLAVLIVPTLLPSSLSPIDSAKAAERCEGDFVESIPWNKTIERFSKTPASPNWDDYYFDEDSRRNSGNEGPVVDKSNEVSTEYDGPEESWQLSEPYNDLRMLNTDIQTSYLVGSGSVGVIRINLDHTMKTTICISFTTPKSEGGYVDYTGDAYLLTSTQWDRYSQTYNSINGGYSLFGEGGDTWEVSPEWRSFDVAGWSSYRDSHQYEQVQDVRFSVSLDGPEQYSGLFGDSSIEYFHILLDNTNNSHRDDALPETTIAAYVSVVSEERSTILPNWTVSLVCCGLMMATIVAPLIMNKRYMGAGLSLTTDNQQVGHGLVPSLEQKTPE
jgi:hypothetical protein